MSNRSRARGTRGENYFLPWVRSLFGEHVERTDMVARDKRATDGDYVFRDGRSLPWLIEAKDTDRAGLTKWVRVCRMKTVPSKRWMLLWKGDARTLDGQPIVVMSLELAEELILSHQLASPHTKAWAAHVMQQRRLKPKDLMAPPQTDLGFQVEQPA